MLAAAFTVAAFTPNTASANGSGVTLEVDPSENWVGYMNVFNNAGGATGSPGSYIFGTGLSNSFSVKVKLGDVIG